MRETRDTEITALRAELAAAKNRALIAEKQDERSRHLVRLWKDDREAQAKALSAMTAERTALAAHVERLEKALQSIWNWEMPETGDVWEDGTPISYAAAYGSIGERRVIRQKAYAALAATPAQSLAAHDAALLREVAKLMDPDGGCYEALLAEADRIEKEAANGSALLRDAKQALSDVIKQADEILDRRGIPRSNAARSERYKSQERRIK